MSGHDGYSVQQARKAVDQIRREKNARRLPVSSCANDLIRYVQENQRDDYLLNAHANDKANPYRVKNNLQCSLL